jgi:hypothetical protein
VNTCGWPWRSRWTCRRRITTAGFASRRTTFLNSMPKTTSVQLGEPVVVELKVEAAHE